MTELRGELAELTAQRCGVVAVWTRRSLPGPRRLGEHFWTCLPQRVPFDHPVALPPG